MCDSRTGLDATVQYVRDEDGVQLLGSRIVQLAFLGDDRMEEWSRDGRISAPAIVDKVPLSCRLVLSGLRSRVQDIPTMLGMGDLLTVATSYPNTLASFAAENQLNLAVAYTPEGGCEGYVASGRADLCFDITNSGTTQAENGLIVYREGDPLKLNVLTSVEYQSPCRDELKNNLKQITDILFNRKRQAREDSDIESPTITLFRSQNALVKKYGEESAEVMQAFLQRPRKQRELVDECADLIYVMRCMLTEAGVTLEDVLTEDIRRNENK